VLIHELTHAWQIEHTDISDGFVPGLMCTGIYNQTVLGQAAYHYGRPGPPWSSFNMEAQAAIVDQWFAGTTPPPPGQKPWKMQDPANPYYGYIANSILTRNP
jgi:hypothetical protein